MRMHHTKEDLFTVVYLRFHHMAQEHCMRSNAWLAASVWLRLAPAATCEQGALRDNGDTLAAAPGLLGHAKVTKQ
jgi:hypothetical protein